MNERVPCIFVCSMCMQVLDQREAFFRYGASMCIRNALEVKTEWKKQEFDS